MRTQSVDIVEVMNLSKLITTGWGGKPDIPVRLLNEDEIYFFTISRARVPRAKNITESTKLKCKCGKPVTQVCGVPICQDCVISHTH